MKRMPALGYLHVAFLLKVRSHLANSELLHENKLKGKNRAFSFDETNHIQIHPEVSNTDGIYIAFNFYYYP
jgi:hypothetical protein